MGNPTILATLAVMAAILPMGSARGLSGPYLRPIPVGAAPAMAFSLVVAFVVTPWAAVRLLEHSAHHHDVEEDLLTRLYLGGVMQPLIASGRCVIFLAGVIALLLAAVALVPLGMGTDEDDAIRQQERIPGDHRHARRAAALETTARVAVSAMASATLDEQMVVNVRT